MTKSPVQQELMLLSMMLPAMVLPAMTLPAMVTSSTAMEEASERPRRFEVGGGWELSRVGILEPLTDSTRRTSHQG